MLRFWRWVVVLGLTGVWAAWAYRYYKCTILKECEPPVPVDSVALRKATHTLFLLLNNRPYGAGYPEFVFNYGSAGATLTDEHVSFLKVVAQQTQIHPHHKLVLIGRCNQSEHRSNHRQELYENLGRARALAVSDKLVLEHGLALDRIEIRGEIMPDSVFYSPLQFALFPQTENPYLEKDISEDDLVPAADTLHVSN